jgi:peptidoglycan/LPS O-acetylase OafA/YrhL
VLLDVFYFATSLGQQAVMIFFVLSGYLIGGEVMREMNNNSFSWKVYLIKRLVRLYIVLIPALLLTVAFDHIGNNFYNFLGGYDRFFDSGKENLTTFLINFFMLQHSHGAIFGSNDPLWSLAYEFWYYLLFPLIAQVCLTKSKSTKIVSIGFILLILSLISLKITLYFSIWLLGVMIWFVPKNIFLNFKPPFYFLSALFLLTVSFSRYKTGFFGDLLVGAAYASIVLYFIYNKDCLCRVLINWKGNKVLANFSYSLYLLHFPFMMLFFNIYYLNYGDIRLELNMASFVLFLLAILLIYLYSYVVFYFSERYNKKVTVSILQFLGIK